MEVRVLRYFLAVAREESITRAAEQLHITQPTLSRQLAQLEDSVGVKLLERGARRVTLTDEGILLKRRAEEIVSLVDKTEKELKKQDDLVEGTIAIGCGELASVRLLAEIIDAFVKKIPGSILISIPPQPMRSRSRWTKGFWISVCLWSLWTSKNMILSV